MSRLISPILLSLLSALLLLIPVSSTDPSPVALQLNNLFLLKPASLPFTPRFNPQHLSYSLSSPTLLSSLTLQANASPLNSLQLRLNDGPFFTLSSTEPEEVDLLEGINHLFLQVHHEEELTRNALTYLITVCNGVDCHVKDEDVTTSSQLASLVMPSVNFTPPFSPSVFDYSAFTSRHTHGAIVTATLLEPSNQLIVASLNGDTFSSITSGRRSPAMPLKLGKNVLFVQIRDATSQLCTYTVTIERSVESEERKKTLEERTDEIEYIGGLAYIRIKESSTDLTSLVTSIGQLSPRFTSAVRQYSIAVDYHVPSLQLTARPKDSDAHMMIFYTSSTSSSPAPASLPLMKDVPSAPIPLSEGLTTIRVQVQSFDASKTDSYTLVIVRASAADENEGITAELSAHSAKSHRPKPSSSKHADPQLVGLKGQLYSVHVEAGQVYNLITEPHLLVNARYVNMNQLNDGKEGELLGIGEIGIKTRTGHLLHLETGESGGKGFSRVALNDQQMNVEDQAYIDNTEESQHEGPVDSQAAAHAELLALNSSTQFTLITPTWYIVFTDSPEGVRVKAVLVEGLELGAHGLVGQTWRDRREGKLHAHENERMTGRGGVGGGVQEGVEGSMEVLEGSMEDYRIQDGNLFSPIFDFNMYEQEGGETYRQ